MGWMSEEPSDEATVGEVSEPFGIAPDGNIMDIERGRDDISVEENARWLAEQLGIPLEHT